MIHSQLTKGSIKELNTKTRSNIANFINNSRVSFQKNC